MRTKYYSLLGALCLMIGVSSCLESEPGPEGPQGEKGEQGEQGIPGTDGNSLLYGNQPPEASDGKEGDFYIDTQTSELYGPKTASGWGNPTDLQGEAGQDGEDGTRIYSGSMSPSLAIGELGDFYFQTTTGILFGPKRSTGWGSGVSLKGPKGDKGDPGTANVLTTGWMRPTGFDWSSQSGIAYVRLNSGQIQSLTAATGATSVRDFINNKQGTVLVYHKSNSGEFESIAQIPTRHYEAGRTYELAEWYVSGTTTEHLNRLNVRVVQIQGSSRRPVLFELRFVFIPSGQILSATVENQDVNDIDWGKISYAEAKALLNLSN